MEPYGHYRPVNHDKIELFLRVIENRSLSPVKGGRLEKACDPEASQDI
jgi:hypothetical protein